MFSIEAIQGVALQVVSLITSSDDVFENSCYLTRFLFPEYHEAVCVSVVTDEEITRETDFHIFFPKNSSPPYPAVLLVSGSSPVSSATMNERRELFLEQGFAVMVLDSFTPHRILEDCFRNDVPCNTYQKLSGNHWNHSQPLPVSCPAINLFHEHNQAYISAFLSRITLGYTLLPAERTHDLFKALEILRQHGKIDRNRLVIIGYSHGGSVVLEALTLTGNRRPPPGDKHFSESRHSLEGVTAVISYYPNCRPGTYFERHGNMAEIPVLAILARYDEYVRSELCQQAIDSTNQYLGYQGIRTLMFDNFHAFDMKEYGAAYDPQSKKLAADKTLKFIREHLDAPPDQPHSSIPRTTGV